MFKRACGIALLGIVALVLSCSKGGSDEVETAPKPSLEERLKATTFVGINEPIGFAKEARRFYEERAYQPAWTPIAIAALVLAIEGAESHGLSSAYYHLATIKSALADTSADPLTLDMLCTDSFLAFGAHLAFGQVDPTTFEPDWRATQRSVDVAVVLAEALRTGRIGQALDSLAPPHKGYALLQAALLRYKSLAWDHVKGTEGLKTGMSGKLVLRLRKRLVAEGYLSPSDSDLFDEEVSLALGIFQRTHGLAQTNTLTKSTLAELNIPATDRAQQISSNLERWRWMPDSLGEKHILVNVPDYRVSVVEGGKEVLAMKAIVGKNHRQTPVFSGDLFEVILNPSWGVPKSIAIKDKLPLIKKDQSYLKSHDFVVFRGTEQVDPTTIDWKKLGSKSFPYQLRQGPGAGNALGRVKFNIHNDFAVYLHDTPDRHLFAENDRSFSSGCIRLEKPRELAAHLLSQTGWDQSRIDAAIKKGTTVRLKLAKPLPVHLLYFTAWAEPDEEASLSFRRDIYGRDTRLQVALDGLYATTSR